MKSARHSWLCALLLTGCAGSSGERSVEAADPSELAYSRLAFVQAGTVTTSLELEGLVKTFDRRGDAWGAWLASQELCQFLYRTRSDDWLVACRDSLARAELTNRGSALFVANMQLYLYTGDPAYVAAAEALAVSEADAAMLSLARREYASLSLPEDAHPDAAVRARQYYWYGKWHNDDEALQVAENLFGQLSDGRGIADVLFLRAQLAADRGDRALARRLAGRSAKTLEALNEPQRAAQVNRWLNDELATD